MARTMAMANLQRSKLNWEVMLKKWCCLSSAAAAHDSYGTHHHLLPVRRWWEVMSKPPWSRLEEQKPPSSGGIIQDDRRISPSQKWEEEGMSKPPWSRILQDDRPTYSPPTYFPPASSYDDSDGPAAAANDSDSISPERKFVGMGLLRPWTLDEAEYLFRPSDGSTPAPRWWEAKFKKPWRLPSGIQDDLPAPPAPQLSMVGSNSNWEGRLKRWMRCLTFCTYPSYSIQDVVINRVLGIAKYFKVPKYLSGDLEIGYLKPEQFEYWLDEIQGYFEFMDLAHELHSIDCLFPLLHHVLVYPHAACIRAKTAELITTMVHNNPKSQQLVMELHGLKPLWYNFTTDPDATSKTKALGAIFALIRNNKSCMDAFRKTYGCLYAAELGDALSSENVSFQREAVNLFRYLLHENCSDYETITTELGLPLMMMMIDRVSGDDAEARVNALRGLLVLAKDDEDGSIAQLVIRNDVELKQVLQELIKRISAMAPEDLVAAREEIQLVDSLWNACYNEPSSLKLFEPSPRAWDAADRKLPIETMLV